MADTNEYTVEIAGIAHTVLLSDDDVERYGAKPVKAARVSAKAARVPNKAATAENKST